MKPEEMKETPPPLRKRARSITTAEGNYVHAGDLKEMLLKDDALIEECASLLVVGHAMKHSGVKTLRFAIGYFIATQAAELARTAEPPRGKAAISKVDLVALATLLEFVGGSTVQEMTRGEKVAALEQAIAGLTQLLEETKP